MSVKRWKLESLSDMEPVSLQKEKWKLLLFPLAIMAIAVHYKSGRVLINGQQCIVVGSVNMNMMTVDVQTLNQ
jgi:alanine racemase